MARSGLVKGMAQAPNIVPEDIDIMFATNVTGLINMTQAILPIFKARPDGGRGDIINIGSIAGREPYQGGSIYCATKAAVRSFTDSLRRELIATRIRIIEIDPGQVETEFSVVRFYGDKEKAKKVYEGVEPLTPDDIAEVVVFAAGRKENVVIADTLIFPNHQVSRPILLAVIMTLMGRRLRQRSCIGNLCSRLTSDRRERAEPCIGSQLRKRKNYRGRQHVMSAIKYHMHGATVDMAAQIQINLRSAHHTVSSFSCLSSFSCFCPPPLFSKWISTWFVKYLLGSFTATAARIARTPKGIDANQVIRKAYAYPYLAARTQASNTAEGTSGNLAAWPGIPRSVNPTASPSSATLFESTPRARAAWPILFATSFSAV